jgi:hypothetical protein
MPNYCNNELRLSHKNPEMMKRAIVAFREGRFLDEFVPMPKELEGTKAPSDGPNWYDWRVANWGTKWDIGGADGDDIQIDERTCAFSFESAWAPPHTVYPVLVGLGFNVLAYWHEPGIGFAGRFIDGITEDFDLDEADDLAALPKDLDEAMGISSWAEIDE